MAVTIVKDSTEVEVLSQKKVVSETDEVTHVIEVLRHYNMPVEIERGAYVVDVVRESGTITNVGAGPELPENAYEGMIWIKT